MGIKNYNFTQGEFGSKSGFFTQLVWRATRLIGCALAVNNENKAYGVAYYYPHGNVIGQFKQNVFPENKRISLF